MKIYRMHSLDLQFQQENLCHGATKGPEHTKLVLAVVHCRS